MTNKRLFTAKLAEHGQTQSQIAKVLGIHRVSIVNKLRDDTFTQTEIAGIIRAWRLTPEQTVEIFFNTKKEEEQA